LKDAGRPIGESLRSSGSLTREFGATRIGWTGGGAGGRGGCPPADSARYMAAAKGATSSQIVGWLSLMVPGLFTLTSVGALLVGQISRVPPVAAGLSGTSVVLAVARFALAFRDVRALADSRRFARPRELTGLRNAGRMSVKPVLWEAFCASRV
jgi:hypothetical protein